MAVFVDVGASVDADGASPASNSGSPPERAIMVVLAPPSGPNTSTIARLKNAPRGNRARAAPIASNTSSPVSSTGSASCGRRYQRIAPARISPSSNSPTRSPHVDNASSVTERSMSTIARMNTSSTAAAITHRTNGLRDAMKGSGVIEWWSRRSMPPVRAREGRSTHCAASAHRCPTTPRAAPRS